MATEPLPRPDLPPEPTEAEYRAFCDTVMATGRGRWFLAEYARRHRKATTQDALDALARLESRLHGGRGADTSHLIEELRSLAATIHHARLEIGWSDSEFSKGAKVMALLELLEDRIGSLIDDNAGEAPAEERGETRVQLTVISANPAPFRARADLPPVDIVADATVVALPAPALPEQRPEPADIALARDTPPPTLAFAAVQLFEPFEAERPGIEQTTVPAAVDFSAEPFDAASFGTETIAPQAFEASTATPAPTEPEAATSETPATADAPPPVIAVPRHSPGYDPMTPVRALSIEERIALVS